MIRRLFLILCMLLLVGGAGAGYFLWYYFMGADGTVRITITQAMITEALEGTFPKKNTYLKILHVNYEKPVVEMVAGRDRMKVSLDVRVEAGLEGVLSKTYKGSAAVDTAVGYDRETFRFFLRDPKIVSLEVPKLSEEQLGILREGLNLATEIWFEEVPIYRIKDRDMKEKAARLMLKEVDIKNDRVVVTLGL